jgi:hypothetical protein
MKKIYKILLYTFIGILLLTSLSVHAFDVRSNRPVTTENQGECDSLFIAGGKGYAVKNVIITEKNVSFVLCDSTDNKVRKVIWPQIQYVKKADGRIITAKDTQENASPEEQENQLEKKVGNLLIITVVSFVVGFGLFTAIPILIKASKYRKKIHGHPKEKKLNKQLNWAIALSLISVLGFILFIILLKSILEHLFDNAFNFDFNYNDDPQ